MFMRKHILNSFFKHFGITDAIRSVVFQNFSVFFSSGIRRLDRLKKCPSSCEIFKFILLCGLVFL